MATIWEEQFAQARAGHRVLQKILLIDDRNAKAYRDLERLYREERKWDALVENYRKHILVTADPDERIDLYTQMGQVYEEELRDPDRAIEAYNDVLSVEPDHTEALRGLARLYEQTEQWERAVEMMRRLIRIRSTPRRRSTSTTGWARSSTSRCAIRRPPRSA